MSPALGHTRILIVLPSATAVKVQVKSQGKKSSQVNGKTGQEPTRKLIPQLPDNSVASMQAFYGVVYGNDHVMIDDYTLAKAVLPCQSDTKYIHTYTIN